MSNKENDIYFKDIRPKLLSFNLPIFDEFINLFCQNKKINIFNQKLKKIIEKFNELLINEEEEYKKEASEIEFKIFLEREEQFISLLKSKEDLIEDLKNKFLLLEDKIKNDQIKMNEPLFKSKNINKLFPQNKKEKKEKNIEFFKELNHNLIIQLQKENNEMKMVLNRFINILLENNIIKEKQIEFDKNNLIKLEEYFNAEKKKKQKHLTYNFDVQKSTIKVLMEIINLSFSLKDFCNLLKNHTDLKNKLYDIIYIEKQEEKLLFSNDKNFQKLLELIEKNIINIK